MYDSDTMQEARLPFPSTIQADKEQWLLTPRGMTLLGIPGLMMALVFVVMVTFASFYGFAHLIADANLLATATLSVLVTLTIPTLFIYVQPRRVLLLLGVVVMLAAAGFTLVLGLLA